MDHYLNLVQRVLDLLARILHEGSEPEETRELIARLISLLSGPPSQSRPAEQDNDAA